MSVLQSLTGTIEPSPLSKYELERLDRIQANRRRMEELGVLETARSLMDAINANKPPPRAPRPHKPKGLRPRPADARRSARLVGEAPKYGEIKGDFDEAVTYSDYEPSGGGLHDLLAGDEDVSSWEPAKQEQFQEIRCTSLGRGSMYDQHVGITCHFCRQKKLCGEEGCPRCSRRSATADCIGKTECGKCHSATGRFCRACLLLRYGQTMEEAMAQMKAGTWLCPHCYEHEHPSEGWMCNSSICMKRRGFAPTGIAIYDAQKRGFQSVAHWLQAQLKKRGAGGASGSGALDAGTPAAAAEELGSRPAAGGERKRGRPRKDPVLAAAGAAGKGAAAAGGAAADQAEPDDGQRRTRARASAAATAAAAAVVVPLKSKGQKAAAAGKDTAPAKDAGPKAARKAAAPKAARAAAAGPTKGGSGAEALSSREGSSEPFAPATPAKPELAEASKGAGPRRALRPRRV